jgi:hypothetical protein
LSASRLSIKDKRAITKSETEVVGKSTMPSAPIDRPSLAVEVLDRPSTAVEVQDPTRTKDETNKDDKKMLAIEVISQARAQRQKVMIKRRWHNSRYYNSRHKFAIWTRHYC